MTRELEDGEIVFGMKVKPVDLEILMVGIFLVYTLGTPSNIRKTSDAGDISPPIFLDFSPNLGIFRPFLGQIFRQFFFAQIAISATELVFRMYDPTLNCLCICCVS